MNKRIVIIVQARLGSTRLPAKAMRRIEGRPMVWHIVSRLRCAILAGPVVLSVPDSYFDTPLREFARASDILYHTGSETDLLSRIYQTAVQFDADAIVRITGDCPFADPGIVDWAVQKYLEHEPDYASNVCPPTFPDGLDVEIYSMRLLERLSETIKEPQRREWFPVEVWEDESVNGINLRYSGDLSHMRWTVDYPEDLEFVRAVYGELYGDGKVFSMGAILDLLERKPEIALINADHSRGEDSPTEGVYT